MALSGNEYTRLAVGGPGRIYGVFTAKSAGAVAAERITRLAVGGPGRLYGTFTAKAAGVPTVKGSYTFLRRRRRF